ncbi:MAG: type II toxin-antitoxin system VapC family toxin [Deltaproteobacteria bacterium]|nr:type II toxin-antitoxin system VapC family toxin [Deltaproteobacteria bacterium]
MTPSKAYLLDTSVLLHLIRGNDIGQAIVGRFDLGNAEQTHFICVVTVGEVFAFAERLRWGLKKQQMLQSLLAQLAVVDINRAPVLKKYAELETQNVEKGLNIGQNDLWIAAATHAADAHLLTADKDFERLGTAIDCSWIDPNRPSETL